MTEYRESEGYLVPTLNEQPITDDPSLMERNPGAELKSLQTFTLTQASVMDAIAAADVTNAKPEAKQAAIDKLKSWIEVMTGSDPKCRELKYFRGQLKRLQEK